MNDMQQIKCNECGVRYDIPDKLCRRLRHLGEVFTCPRTCEQCYPAATPETLYSKMDTFRGLYLSACNLASERAVALRRANRTISALRGANTKHKRHIAELESMLANGGITDASSK